MSQSNLLEFKTENSWHTALNHGQGVRSRMVPHGQQFTTTFSTFIFERTHLWSNSHPFRSPPRCLHFCPFRQPQLYITQSSIHFVELFHTIIWATETILLTFWLYNLGMIAALPSMFPCQFLNSLQVQISLPSSANPNLRVVPPGFWRHRIPEAPRISLEVRPRTNASRHRFVYAKKGNVVSLTINTTSVAKPNVWSHASPVSNQPGPLPRPFTFRFPPACYWCGDLVCEPHELPNPTQASFIQMWYCCDAFLFSLQRAPGRSIRRSDLWKYVNHLSPFKRLLPNYPVNLEFIAIFLPC